MGKGFQIISVLFCAHKISTFIHITHIYFGDPTFAITILLINVDEAKTIDSLGVHWAIIIVRQHYG